MSKLKFKVDSLGDLYVSENNGCSYEFVGHVGGENSTVPGPQGPQGLRGIKGEDGINGIDGVTPTISDNGTWIVNGHDTGIIATGKNGEIEIDLSEDITVVGTPSVTSTIDQEGVTHLKFHQLKGEKGESGSEYKDGNYIAIGDDGAINCTLEFDDGLVVNENVVIVDPDYFNKDYLPLAGGTMNYGAQIQFGDSWSSYIGFDHREGSTGLHINSGQDDDLYLEAYDNMWLNVEGDNPAIHITGDIIPESNHASDIGSNGLQFRNGYFDKIFTSNGSVQSSDIRKKNIIEELSLTKAYELVDKCSTILYTLKDDPTNKVHVGTIAQEVEKFFPELVSTDEAGFKALDYAKLTVILLRVMRDVISRIGKLETIVMVEQ